MASAGSWPFALSEIGANPNTGKDLGTKLLETSATLFIDTSVHAPSVIIESFTFVLVTILALSDFDAIEVQPLCFPFQTLDIHAL